METVQPLEGGLVKVLALAPVAFTWKSGPREGEADIGFIAQDVEKIVPEVVHTDGVGIKSVDYAKLLPVLMSAVQEQQKELEELEAAVNARKKAIQALKNDLANI